MVRFVIGDFKGSIGDLSRALVLGQNQAETYFQRGLAYYYAGQWRKAAEDFATYGKAAKDERKRARASIWRALAYRQTGAAMPARDPGITGWPATTLAMFDDKASAEDVIERLNRNERGRQLEEDTAEAYFYLSRHFAVSNRSKARAYLHRCLDLGALYSLVRVAAHHELRRLESTPHRSTASEGQP
jgi:lipoprotein NlpI